LEFSLLTAGARSARKLKICQKVIFLKIRMNFQFQRMAISEGIPFKSGLFHDKQA